jgi:hypothetical protein
MVKPGYKTSEFWFTLVSFLFSGLYLLGLLDSNSQKEDLINETSKGLEAVVLIIGQLTVLFKYIKGRNEIKKVWWNTASPIEREEANKRNVRKRGTENDNPRTRTTSKTRTRKSNK